MKIAFINTLYTPHEVGGAERAVRAIAEAAVERGHEAIVITLNPESKQTSKRVIAGVTVYYVPLANIHWHLGSDAARPAWRRAIWHLIDAYNPIMAARVQPILALERPDVMETNNLQGFSVSIWATARRLGIPVVQMLHDYYLGCSNSTMFKRGANCTSQCATCSAYCIPRRLLSDIPNVVSSVSDRVLERLRASAMFVHASVTSVVPTGISLPAQNEARKDKPKGTQRVFGYFGRIEHTKGIEIALRAMHSLSSDQAVFLIGGTGKDEYMQRLQHEFSGPQIRFLGFTEPQAFFAQIDVLLVPSIWEEPLGRVIYEGFANGVPAIVANIGGMPEIIDPGVTGYIVPPNDVDGLAVVLRQLVNEDWPTRKFADACYAASQRFGIDRIFEQRLADWVNAIECQRARGAAATHVVTG